MVRKITAVNINVEVLKLSKLLGINRSQICEEALKQEIKRIMDEKRNGPGEKNYRGSDP